MSLRARVREARVTAELAGDRLDRACSALFEGLSRGEARRAIERGGVTIGGRRVRACSRAVSAGDVLTVAEAPPVTVASAPLRVVYEDADLLVVDKPSGQLTQPTELGDAGTLVADVEAYLRTGRNRPFVGVVHRLDREASGLVLLGRTPRSTAALDALLREHRIERVYAALVRATPTEESGLVDLPLRHDRRTNRAHVDARDGKPARTRWGLTARAADEGIVALELVLETGRTHQIRAHMAASLGPLVGDRRYGDPRREVSEPRLFLHARRLSFEHPRTHVLLALESPLPPEFEARLAPVTSSRSDESAS